MKMFSLLAAATLFSSIPVTYAAEPVTLTDTQLDSVVAGDATSTVSGTVQALGRGLATASITGSATTSASPEESLAQGSLDIVSEATQSQATAAAKFGTNTLVPATQ